MINVVKMLTVDEGLKYRVYKDTVGKKTIGIGFNMDAPGARRLWQEANIKESFESVYKGEIPLSVASVGDLFDKCVTNCRTEAKQMFPDYDAYPEHVKLVLVNLIFNMGKSVFSQFAYTIKLIKEKKFDEAAENLKKTKWATQVKTRVERVTELLKGNDALYG